MQAFFKRRDLISSANAADTAIYNNVYKGNCDRDYSESFRLMKEFVDQSLDEVKRSLASCFPNFCVSCSQHDAQETIQRRGTLLFFKQTKKSSARNSKITSSCLKLYTTSAVLRTLKFISTCVVIFLLKYHGKRTHF
jgi:hypothetical protein